MNKFTLAAIGTVAILLAGCSHSDRPSETSLINIDLEKQIEAQPTGLDRAEARFVVQPALTDSSMLLPPTASDGVALRGVHNGCLMLTNKGSMMTFDEADGRCIHSFSHIGQGPGDYSWLSPYTYVGADGNWNTVHSCGVNVYTQAGDFLVRHELDSLREIAPLPGGYWAAMMKEFDQPQTIYIYDTQWKPVKQLSTTAVSRRYRMSDGLPVTEIVDFSRSSSFVGVMQGDTLMAIDPEAEDLVPIARIDCGTYSKPKEYTSLEDMKEKGAQCLYFFTFPVGKYLMVNSYMGEKAWLQFYDRADGSLVYSNSGTRNLNNGSISFPIEIDGTTYPCSITACVDGSTLYLVTDSDFMAELTGDEDANPAFISHKLKD